MKVRIFAKIAALFIVTAMAFGCQEQASSNSAAPANSANSNVNSGNANSAKPEIETIPEPQTIKFESADQVEIVGTFYRSPKINSPAVLLLHQFGSDRSSYREFALRLQKAGFGVLAIDGRGFGDSVKTIDGKPVPVSRTDDAVTGMKADVAGAFEFLSKQKNV
ncbi:MAG: alpha/beta hydrolase, partial [Acidobacteria bacterium]|nr:alpha/beta hydrolase [Acidobacteriota bacterium]